jgi:hypothetical protein
MSLSKIRKLTKQIEKLENNIADLEARIDLAFEKVEAGDISKAEYYKYKQELSVEARAIRGTIRRKEKARLFQERKLRDLRKEKEKKDREKEKKRQQKLREKEEKRRQKLKEKEKKRKQKLREKEVKSRGKPKPKGKKEKTPVKREVKKKVKKKPKHFKHIK